MNRREILRTGSLSTLGLLAAQTFPSARAQDRAAGANGRIRIGIVGFSDRLTSSLLPAYKAVADQFNCEIVGVSDLWSRRRDDAKAYFKKKFDQDIETYRNNEEMYEKAKLDAVIISTADFQHATHAIEAIAAGCDVYCEKPFAETMEDARAALKAVKSSDRILQVGSQRRSGENYAAAHEFLKSGKFGPIVAAEMTWNVNQPGRWRRPDLVAALKEEDIDWKRFLCNRPDDTFDPRKYLEYRLFWPYSSGIPGQWMCHQIDTVHWFTGLPHPRSVAANGGIYQWKDGRKNFDTLTAVFDYGPLDDPSTGFQVTFSSRFSNSAGGTKEIYYSNGGELNLDTNKVTSNGGLGKQEAGAMKLEANLLEEFKLEGTGGGAASSANTGADPLTTSHMKNWLECLVSRKQPHAPVEAGYQHSIATIMANAAARTGERVTFDEKAQEVLAGGKVFKY
ncbi:Gfo/Idh/MocA family oxidoreductase [Luteolibacter yonseiensis]|uniref:Gfo/Idh/MocA family oxidoreductase n=1 Tax=Luteolibacter yonseiensis TaxID=1144680 RepID=A0A934R5V6_9BACT|nr:Gfo/Idh/MocA family oxidoreductase [Luteolibacter yonseiensis]MBK1816947.1 Gfo/Idh/MocA family oxidoreductase [Luteolibacter yonseiensis]